MKRVSIDWSNVSVTDSYQMNEAAVANVIARYERNSNLGRTKDPSYEIEKEFMEYLGHDQFIHRIYQIMIFPMNRPFYVKFGPNDVVVGTELRR